MHKLVYFDRKPGMDRDTNVHTNIHTYTYKQAQPQDLDTAHHTCTIMSLTLRHSAINPLVSMLPKITLLTAYHFIACLLEMLFTHKMALLLVVISVAKWVV